MNRNDWTAVDWRKPVRQIAFLLLLNWLPSGIAQEWPRFRGPNGSGVSLSKTIPTTWTNRDFNWKIPLPGAGHSSPVLWDTNVFLTAGDAKTKQVSVICVSAHDGRMLWQKSFPFTPHSKSSLNTFASASPTVDQHRVYVCWTSPMHYTLMALTHDGQTVWEKDLGPFASKHGGGASPIVYQDKIVLGNEQDGESFLIAVDAATGKTRWQTPRKAKGSRVFHTLRV